MVYFSTNTATSRRKAIHMDNSIGNRKQIWNEEASKRAKERWDQIQHPLHGLGLLEDAIVQIAGLTGDADISLDKKAVIIFCADNGVTKEQVAQTDSFVTGIVAGNLVRGTTAVCRMAAVHNVNVIPVDVGIKDFPGRHGVIDRRISNGTRNMLHGPAMTRSEAERALKAGIDLAGELKQKGYRLLGVGEMGIGNTTTSSACASVLLEQDPAVMTGRGAGLSDAGLRRKIEVIREAIQRNHLDGRGSLYPDTIGILARVGGFDLLGMCGLYIGGYLQRIPLLIDGFASSVAALAAVRICPACESAMLASHVSSEPAAKMVLDALEKEPLITAGLHLGEGTGAVLAMPMLDMALAVYRECETFEEGGVEAYRPL